jgi:Ferritin-like
MFSSLSTALAGRSFSLRGGEPAIVVERRKELTYLLCQAAELEHAVMCEYLYAAFSLKSTAGPALRDDRLGAVEGWRGVLFAIAKEEMLHWLMFQAIKPLGLLLARLPMGPVLGVEPRPLRACVYRGDLLMAESRI